MPFDEDSLATRHEFAELADREDVNMSALCRGFGISRPTGYKWLRRYREGGRHGLIKRSRKPKHSPSKTPSHVEAEVLTLREEHPVWGGRKLSAWLRRAAAYEEHPLEPEEVPAASTITDILHRHGVISAERSEKHTAWKRFEWPEPTTCGRWISRVAFVSMMCTPRPASR